MCESCSRRWHGAVRLGRGSCPQCIAARGVKLMVDVEQHPGETKDGTGAGDHDRAYAWGNPKACLTTVAVAHLLVLRGRVRDDHEHGMLGGMLDGDTTLFRLTDSGLYVPAEIEP